MSRLCPHCLKELPAMELPVCAYCGERLAPAATAPPEPAATVGPPPVPGESAAVLIERFFATPQVYSVTWPSYLLTVGAALLLPSALLWSQAPAAAALAICAGAWFLAAYHGWRCWPPRTRVVIDRRGVESGGVLLRWERLRGVETSGRRRRRSEPAKLAVSDDRGRQIILGIETCRTADIQSLNNLCSVLSNIIAARPK